MPKYIDMSADVSVDLEAILKRPVRCAIPAAAATETDKTPEPEKLPEELKTGGAE